MFLPRPLLVSVAAVFRSVDADGSGRVDKEEFKAFAKRLDMGLNVQQMQELWGWVACAHQL